MTADPQPTRSTYVGLFFVALATLMYQILLTRVCSVALAAFSRARTQQ